jgi:hypothetical protein
MTMVKRFLFLAGMIFFVCISLSAEEALAEEAIPPSEMETPIEEVSEETEDMAEAETPVEETETDEEEDGDTPIDPALYNIIAHIMDDDVIFAIDPEAGVAVGDVYTLVRDGEKVGLLLVNEVQKRFAIARVISFATDPLLGDEAREASRAGVEATFYGGSFLKTNYSQTYIPLAGLKLVVSRGFFYTRPVLEIEFPSARAHPDLALSDVIPFNIMIGAEITNLYFGRFQLASVMLLGMGGAYMGKDAQELFGVKDAFHKTHVSGKAFLSLSCLIFPHLKITADAGILALVDVWPALSDVEPSGYFGRNVAPFVTFGLTLR